MAILTIEAWSARRDHLLPPIVCRVTITLRSPQGGIAKKRTAWEWAGT